MICGLETVWNEPVVACFKILYQNMLERTEKKSWKVFTYDSWAEIRTDSLLNAKQYCICSTVMGRRSSSVRKGRSRYGWALNRRFVHQSGHGELLQRSNTGGKGQ